MTACVLRSPSAADKKSDPSAHPRPPSAPNLPPADQFFPASETAPIQRFSRHLLLVEDDPFIRPLLVQILTKAGYHVFAAETGSEALDIFQTQREQLHAAIVDIVLPDIHGTEVFACIRQDHPTLPVVMISGFSNAPHVALTGPATFLQKPFNPQELLGALDQLLAS